MHFDGKGFAKCPFHDGDSPKSMHLYEHNGVWLAKCFSECNKSFDAIAFVQTFDGVDFKEAVARLNGPPSEQREKRKVESVPMTAEGWASWGREIIQADVDRLAKSRLQRSPSKTPLLETLRAADCRVKGDFIGFPYKSNRRDFHTVKMLHLDRKEYIQECNVSQQGFFNLPTVEMFDDVYVTESELDALVLEEAGFQAVSVVNASQLKFEPAALALLCVAKRIFLVGDQDGPGQPTMDALGKLLPMEQTFRIRWPLEVAKDACELAYSQGDGFREHIKILTEEALIPWVNKNIPTISAVSKDPQRWLVDRMLPYGGLTILCGKQGAMKSIFALFLAKYLSSPLSDEFLGRPVHVPDGGLPVLYLDRENPESTIGERRWRVGIIGSDTLRYWGDWLKEDTPEPDDPRVLEWVHRTGGLVVFDSLQDWYGDAREIDNTAMVKLMHKFKHLARRGAGVLLLHHDAKYGEQGWRRGTAIVALPDMSIGAKKSEQGDHVIELREIRFRQCAAWELDFRVSFNQRVGDEILYGIAVERDQTKADAIQEQKSAQSVRAAKKASKNARDAEQVDKVLSADLTQSARQMERDKVVPFRRNRIAKLAALKGWRWTGEKWEKEANPEPDTPLLQQRD